MTKFCLCLLPLLALLAAGSSMDSHTAPKADLAQYRHIFVEHVLSDGNGIDQLIARELRARGYDATSGFLTMMPDDAELVVAYQDHFTYDFSNYMIDLDVLVRTARTEKQLALVRYHRPSLGAGSTVEMVDRVVDSLFPAKPAKS